MYRKVSVFLEKWKDSPYRKPLILQGARQVGISHKYIMLNKYYRCENEEEHLSFNPFADLFNNMAIA